MTAWFRECFTLFAVSAALLGSASACAQPTSKPDAPQMCGGIAGFRCAAGFTCVMEGKPYPDQAGVCRPAESRTVCPMIYQPVCGADGATYANRCIAESKGATVARAGRCEAPSPPVPTAPAPAGTPG